MKTIGQSPPYQLPGVIVWNPSFARVAAKGESTVEKALARICAALTALALAIRIAIMWIPGNSVKTPWSGGGDMEAYVLLAKNLVTGRGYTYAYLPTAFRAPGYPFFLASMMELFGEHFVLAARILQGVAGLVAAYFCMRTARILFGKRAGQFALLATLFCPTLLYFSGEILTEGLTSFFLALFLWAFAEDTQHANSKTAAAMGCIVGLGALVRANMALLGLVALAGGYVARPTWRAKRELVIVPVCAGLILAPWIIRNWAVFGSPLLSTETGAAVLVSLVNPEARLMSGWDKAVHEAVGYVVPNQLETNGDERLDIGSELNMNRKCMEASGRLWRQMNTRSRVGWVLGKWEAYWFSTDQLLHPGTITRINRGFHVAAVLFYWILLLLAGIGCWNLRKSRPNLALILVGYAILMTIAHTPFVMNSRIRAPLLDPLIAVMSGGGIAALMYAAKKEIKMPSASPSL